MHDPAIGEDVKVMAFRHGDPVRIVLACAMIDAALRGAAGRRGFHDHAGRGERIVSRRILRAGM